jgi:hypothetical protein
MSNSEGLSAAIIALIRGGVPPAQAAKIIAEAPKNTRIQAIKNSGILAQNIINLIQISNPGIKTKIGEPAFPPKAIKNSGILAQNIINLIQLPTPGSVSKFKTKIEETVPPDVAAALLAFISGQIPPAKAKDIALTTPPAEMPKKLSDIGGAILKLISNSILVMNAELNNNGKPKPAPNGYTLETVNGKFIYKKKPVEGPKNMLPLVKNLFGRTKPPPKGFILNTRNGITGYYRNTAAPPGNGQPVPPPLYPMARTNYSKMNIKNLLNARRKKPDNKNLINKSISNWFSKEIYEIERKRGSARIRRIGDLLRMLPMNFPKRSSLTALIIDDLRDARNYRNLDEIIRNLGRVPNENVKREIDRQRRMLSPRRRQGEPESEYRRRLYNSERGGSSWWRGGGGYNSGRGGGVAPPPRINRGGNYGRGSGVSPPPRVNRGGNYGRGGGGVAPPPRRNNGGGSSPAGLSGVSVPPPPLPPSQQTAINNAGGVSKSLNTVAAVPGGAPEIAKAAEALNETSGNATQAIEIKGASPVAVKAVQTLGGSKNAINVLDGLNTLSQTTATRIRKARSKKRVKKYRPRIAELNRVIEAVKKQKLISLVAHNVTKTHNLHPNDEKLKGYYKKIIKANILRTPFSKIVRTAAKKNK